MSRPHPYKELETTPTWRAIDRGIAELVENGDLIESTGREYIVGYLTKLVRATARSQHPRPGLNGVRSGKRRSGRKPTTKASRL